AFTAHVEAKRWSLPEHPQVAGVLGVERALAVAQPRHEGAAGLLAENVPVRLSPVADRLFDDLREPTRDLAEESVPGTDQVAGRVARRRWRLRLLHLRHRGWRRCRSARIDDGRRRGWRSRLLGSQRAGATADQQKNESRGPQDRAHGVLHPWAN